MTVGRSARAWLSDFWYYDVFTGEWVGISPLAEAVKRLYGSISCGCRYRSTNNLLLLFCVSLGDLRSVVIGGRISDRFVDTLCIDRWPKLLPKAFCFVWGS